MPWYKKTALHSVIVLHLAAAFGLMKHKRWARRLAGMLSAVQLLNMPLGAVVGSFVLYACYRDTTPKVSTKEAQFNAS